MARRQIDPSRSLAQIEDENRFALADLEAMTREPLAKIGRPIMPAHGPLKFHAQPAVIVDLLRDRRIGLVARERTNPDAVPIAIDAPHARKMWKHFNDFTIPRERAAFVIQLSADGPYVHGDHQQDDEGSDFTLAKDSI
jgi:hypothetical protein